MQRKKVPDGADAFWGIRVKHRVRTVCSARTGLLTPANGFFAAVTYSSERKLNTSVGRQDNTISPYAQARPVSHCPFVHRSPPLVRDVRERPHVEQNGKHISDF
jgi:hypothetical protein